MSSLVSEFIINPVARTVRRFSTPFATATDTDSVRRFPHEYALDNGDAIAACDVPSISFPGLPFLRSPDIALGARSPPLLVPQRRYPVPPDEADISRDSTPRSSSPPIFEMDNPSTADAEPATPDEREALRAEGQDASNLAAARNSHSLPANDGMNDMRRKIQTIQSSSITFDQKRYLMQQVLTESYAKARHAKAVLEGRTESPAPRNEFHPAASSSSRDLGFGISALETLKSWTGLDEGQDPINFSEVDARPTYRPKLFSPSTFDELGEDLEEEEEDEDEEIILELGCPHYKRNVRVQCAECEKWYTCRLCHDDVEEHTLPRRLTKNMLCMLCGHAQKASDTCAHCGESAASYFCSICKLWSDDMNKHIYHCDDCGICRVGRGLEKDFFHCKVCVGSSCKPSMATDLSQTCCACISIATKEDHKCIERATDANCPICNDIMFSSPQQVIFMECGHPIHRNCFEKYMTTSYKCPLCSKSIVKMDALFLNLANIIKEQPMPVEYQKVRSILFCNDCSAKSSTQFHFLGLRCQICQSFNTVELDRSPMPTETAADQPEAAPTDPPQLDHLQYADDGWHIVNTTDRALRSPDHNGAAPYGISLDAEPSGRPRYAVPEINLDEDEAEEELDFWGGDARSQSSEDRSESEGDEEDSDVDEEEEDDEEDDNDEEEPINLFGHR